MAVQIAQYFQPFLLRPSSKSGVLHRLKQSVELCSRLAFQFKVSAVLTRFSQGKMILSVGFAIGAD